MRIWFLTTEFPPMFGGGIATYTFHAAQMWQREGHQVTVFLYDDRVENTMTNHQDGIRVVRFSMSPVKAMDVLGHVARLAYEYASRVASLIEEDGQPDIIESQDYLGIAYFILQRKYTLDPLFKTIPIVIVGHSAKFLLDPLDEAPLYQLPEFWTGEMERFCYRAADLVVSPSHVFHAHLERALPGLSTVTIPNPFTASFSMLSNTEDEAHDLLYIGRIQYLKGPHLLLDALETLARDGISVKADFIGGDTEFIPKSESLTKFLSRHHQTLLNSQQITFHGALPPDALPDALRNHRIVILPSLFESFSYVLLEAMHAKRVVVASATGIAPEIIQDGFNGYLFPVGDTAGLIRGLRLALSQSEDDRTAMGERAHHSIDSMSYSAVLETRIAAYQALRQVGPRRAFPWIRPVPSVPPLVPGRRELSVVIPFYNMGSYIDDTLNSLQQVTGIDMEIIIVNDGSTDQESITVLERIAADSPQVHIIHTPNQGLARARNVGATQAQGSYLAFLDADDCVEKRYYEKALEILRHFTNVSFVAAWTQYFGANDNLWITWNTEPPYILYHNTVNSSALIYRRQDFIQYGINDASMVYGMEDWESVIRLVSHGYRGVAIPEPLFRYRIRPDSMSRAFNRENQLYLYHRLTELNRDFYDLYGRDIIHLMNANGPQAQVDNPTWQVGWVVQNTAPPALPAPPPSCFFRIRRRIRRLLREGR